MEKRVGRVVKKVFVRGILRILFRGEAYQLRGLFELL